jgi:gas vesicle protein
MVAVKPTEVVTLAEGKKKKGGLLFGAIVGVTAGLLLAPRTGKESREKLFGGGMAAQKDRLREAMGAGMESAADRSESLREKIEETRNRLREQMSQAPEE